MTAILHKDLALDPLLIGGERVEGEGVGYVSQVGRGCPERLNLSWAWQQLLPIHFLVVVVMEKLLFLELEEAFGIGRGFRNLAVGAVTA